MSFVSDELSFLLKMCDPILVPLLNNFSIN